MTVGRATFYASMCFATLVLLTVSPAQATPLVVNATDVIYAAGTQSAVAAADGGSVPEAVIPIAGYDPYVTFSAILGSRPCAAPDGCVSLNNGYGENDADGTNGPLPGIAVAGTASLSGLTAPGEGYLTGVFISSTGPSGPAPAALDFTTSGTAFPTLAPALDQVFFIGDGLTGDGSGIAQQFYAPSGATELVLGISDACATGAAGGCYVDNLGTYAADATVSVTVPEPASVGLLASGLLGMLVVRGIRKRKQASILP